MQSKKDEKDLADFLAKVSDIDSILKDLSSSDAETQRKAIAKADKEIAKQKKKEVLKAESQGFDRTVINKNAYVDDQPPGPTFTEENTSQEQFLSSLEADCQRRAAARKERHRKANLVKDRGNVAFKDEQYDEAIKLYTEASTIAKDLTPLYTNRAASYMKLGEYEKAIDDCDFALRIDEKWIKACVLKARSLQKLHKFDEAVQEFSKVLDIDKTKRKMIDDYLAALEDERRTHELEVSVRVSLEEEKQDSMSITSLISSLRTRLEEERLTTSDVTSNLMYYAGGFRILQTRLIDDKSKTLFRTEGGFKLLTGPGSVSKCLKSEVKYKARAPPHSRDLIAATVSLCTAACSQLPENLKVLLSEDGVPEMFLSFLASQNEQVKRSAITFFHEASLTSSGRSTLRANVDCVRLSVLLLRPSTKKADANSSASATLSNLSLDKKFCVSLENSFETELLPLFQDCCLNEVGSSSYEALNLRMCCLNHFMADTRIRTVVARHKKFRECCLIAVERCVAQFKRGLSNPCGMEELLQLLRSMLKAEKDESSSNVAVSLLSPVLVKTKDKPLLEKCLSLLGLFVEQWASCTDNLFKDGATTVFKHLFHCLKQDDILLKTHALKILCCGGQHKPEYLRSFLQFDRELLVLRSILTRGDEDVDRLNQGHVALILGGLSSLEGGLEPVLSAKAEGDVVRRLLVLCRDGGNKQMKANCAIALGKMAIYDQRFLTELRNHDGINILSKQNPDELN